MSDLLLREGEWDVVDPGSADWRYLSFRVDRLHDGENFTRNTGGEEIALVPLGGRCSVDTPGERYEVGGRASVFDGMARHIDFVTVVKEESPTLAALEHQCAYSELE